ncbi:hypothetical protein PAECIP111891_03412 [Paenibacillus allorhizoplanae]|uniref:Uncharacterized protein n=1 Tax=Paenibacillus allorhizoplanae TaxID=2905648 RepID=A0ABN8GID9_9BACL|nr:hypothetical protein PAECIP111891_03412 [Paenibacillus allorhizoplanae]
MKRKSDLKVNAIEQAMEHANSPSGFRNWVNHSGNLGSDEHGE